MKLIAITALAAAAAAALTGCDSASTAVTAGICSDAAALKASSIALNKNESTGLQGLITACDATAGGTVFNNLSVANAIIADAILLQSSGLLKDIHITALAPAQKLAVKKIDMDFAKAKAFGFVK